jgi:hypothetical protein
MEGLADRRVAAALLHDVARATAKAAASRGMVADNNPEATLLQIKT